MTQPKKPASNPKALNLTRPPGQTEAQALSRAALRPCINGASVIEAYQVNLMGKDVDLGELGSCQGRCRQQVVNQAAFWMV